MELCLRFDPSVGFKRLLTCRQIDEDGVVYADAFDQIGSAPQGMEEVPTLSSHLTSSQLLLTSKVRPKEGSVTKPQVQRQLQSPSARPQRLH